MKLILNIHRNHMHARDAWRRARDENPSAEASHATLTMELEGAKIMFVSASALDRRFFMGRHFDEINGIDYVSDPEIRDELKIRLRLRSVPN